ncbi:MAG: DNA mismatch repair protein MutS [Candidatus Binatia bacterium]
MPTEKKRSTPESPAQSPQPAETTEMMEQYRRLKTQYQDALLFFRLGDFYEMFYDDAVIGARELDIVLTSRPQGRGGERIPLCGVPHHRLESYLSRLIEKGYKVAICEQLEEPQRGKKVIRRDVVRVVTPGTLFETSGKDQVLAAVFPEKDRIGAALLELSTGEFLVAEMTAADLPGLFAKHQPREIVIREGDILEKTYTQNACVSTRPKEEFAAKTALNLLGRAFGRESVESLGLRYRRALIAAGALLSYVQETQRTFLPHLSAPQPYQQEEFVWLDPQTQRNLELVENVLEGTEEGSLLSVLDDTQTRMGKRRLRHWLLHPLLSVAMIRQRQEAVVTLSTQLTLRAELRKTLARILDLERLTSRISSGIANPRDLSALRSSLAPLPQVRKLLAATKTELLQALYKDLDTLSDVQTELQHVLVDEPRAVAKEGGLIRAGVSTELDELRTVQTHGTEWLAQFEQQEREHTAIPNLRVGFNRVFGYYLEVTKSYVQLVPQTYQRRQTLVHAERFITDELKRFEERVLSATDRGKELEYELFVSARERVAAQAGRLRHTAHIIGMIDVLCSLAEVAAKRRWIRPTVTDDYVIQVTEGRHPVIEEIIGSFVPNDLHLDERSYLLLLTGPNAAGKSTYVRQAALLVILAQMGSFVPADVVTIGVVDRIFTRVGAADFLARGLSTFMVEMQETAAILRQATRRSLIILDEVGRGTGTSDGQAIAQAVAELLAQEVKAKTLFTTHYHELAHLAETMPGITNARLEVREDQGEVKFLYKVVPGAAQKSYGVYVAKLAGLPPQVIERATQLLADWQNDSVTTATATHEEKPQSTTSALSPLLLKAIEELDRVDLLHTTPMEALLLLAEIKKAVNRRS